MPPVQVGEETIHQPHFLCRWCTREKEPSDFGRRAGEGLPFQERSQGGSCVGNLFFGIVPTEGKTDRAGRIGAQRFVGGRRTVQTDPGHDAVFVIERIGDFCRVTGRGLHRDNAGTVLNIFFPDQTQETFFAGLLQHLQKGGGEGELVLPDGF